MILTSGCFDGLHAGHVLFLSKAREMGGDVRVIVAPDDYIRTAKAREPYWRQAERGYALESIKWVTAVILQPPDVSVADLIRLYRPSYFVKGSDWTLNSLPVEIRTACRDVGSTLQILETPGKHTSEARG